MAFTYRNGPVVPADIITYKHAGKLVYVKPAENYELALDFAQKEFPEELAHVPRERIMFTISVNVQGERRHVRISESAWPGTVGRLLRGEVIDVGLRPDPSAVIPPPQYLEVPSKETAVVQPKPKSVRHSRSTPSSRSHSPAPSNQSDKGSSTRIRSWFGGK
ncbi:hypothetical protein K443DRAFT_671626 [Laccaria amethystina LaAM-08-1]|uniref:Uncharacterized protein n=1 Tax=Laccaria amethystina LaAM-08-1 TaxID=1095629 RepID=A0A0C9YMB1_9AGAR|nr:hypothetical protein K443DRAFT_671626 [Laccaria amethystina LaAM-08-1]